jgi:hypothetical protein
MLDAVLGLLFDPEDGANTFLRTVGKIPSYYTASHNALETTASNEGLPGPQTDAPGMWMFADSLNHLCGRHTSAYNALWTLVHAVRLCLRTKSQYVPKDSNGLML